MTGLAEAAVTITLDGRPVRAADRLRAVRVASRLAQPAQCELRFDATEDPPQWPSEWRFGGWLVVRMDGAPEDLFAGEITCVELTQEPDGSPELRIRAYDLLHRLRDRQRLRVFEKVTAADLAKQLVGDLSVDVIAAEPGPRLDRVLQHRQSDLEMLCEASVAAGLHPVLRDRRLRLVTLAGHGDPVELIVGRSLWGVRVSANVDRVARRVTALGWHSQRAEFTTVSTDRPRTGSATGNARLRKPDVDGERYLTGITVRDPDQLAATAQAALDAATGRAVTVAGVADGDPALWAGRRVRVSGAASVAEGYHTLSEAVHTIDGNGFQTRFTTEPPPHTAGGGTDRSAAVVTLGQVTAVNDPEKRGRVRLSLPAHGDLDAGWLGVLCPGAGADRGLVVLPDVGDTVLVALPAGVPADGVVLGSVYGMVRPPDSGVDGDAVRRWSMRTAGGQSLIVDDVDNRIQLENRAGSTLELGPDLLRLHAATDLVIEAPGRAITVRAASVDFDRAG